MSQNWFHSVFGFVETNSFVSNRAQFEILRDNGRAKVGGDVGRGADNAASHPSLAEEENVVLFCIPNNTRFHVGPFSVNSVAELRTRLASAKALQAAAAASSGSASAQPSLEGTEPSSEKGAGGPSSGSSGRKASRRHGGGGDSREEEQEDATRRRVVWSSQRTDAALSSRSTTMVVVSDGAVMTTTATSASEMSQRTESYLERSSTSFGSKLLLPSATSAAAVPEGVDGDTVRRASSSLLRRDSSTGSRIGSSGLLHPSEWDALRQPTEVDDGNDATPDAPRLSRPPRNVVVVAVSDEGGIPPTGNGGVDDDDHKNVDDEAFRLPLTFSHIVNCDIRAVHRNPTHAGCVIQVASQFNCLEMIGPSVSPEDGITCYARDPTQGPACALCCPAATAFRNYRALGGRGQTARRQINTLRRVEALLDNETNGYWSMVNGYLLPKRPTAMREVTDRLRDAESPLSRAIVAAVEVGVHWDTEVHTATKHRLCQVFASATPVNYAKSTSSSDWALLSCLILEAAYEATLTVAAVQAVESRRRVPVFLTLVGGGAFANRHEWIVRAIKRALVTLRDAPLDVFLAHYPTVVPEQYRGIVATPL